MIGERVLAAGLAELTLGEPSGLVPDMGGPQVYSAVELFCSYSFGPLSSVG